MKTTIKRALAFINVRAALAFAFVSTLLVSVAPARATDPDVTSIVTSAGSLLTSIYPIVLGAVSFGILISLVKMVRRGK